MLLLFCTIFLCVMCYVEFQEFLKCVFLRRVLIGGFFFTSISKKDPLKIFMELISAV